jgi:shikimate kinase
MKNIILTGFMGAGKSAVGKKLGERLKLKVIDTDDVVEEDSGRKISDIFSQQGEKYFRKLEKDAVKKVSALEDHVIITGGGVVLDKENMENLRKTGTIIYLHARPEVLYERIKNETHRPLLQVKNPLMRIRELLNYRARFYSDNDLEIDTSDLDVGEVVGEIVRKINPV